MGSDAADAWAPGDILDGRYELVRRAGQGGMGLVYQARHLQWGIDLALKRPLLGAKLGADQVGQFIREAEAWVDVGVHPNVCCCHYVRNIDGIPVVFAEYVAHGSLHDWITDRRLYQGSGADTTLRLLDVAIQFAWGLDHAHTRGLVHQDVKPANVLVDLPGGGLAVKVTDFGLARARVPLTAPGSGCGAGTAVTGLAGHAGFMTVAYASPEQAKPKRGALSRGTDIYSFAVSVLEMFIGGRTWTFGDEAGEALTTHLAKGPEQGMPAMPPALARLLGRCLSQDPGRRPGTMLEVAVGLAEVFLQVSGTGYPRQAPRPADLLADEHNNRALSLIDLGREAEADAAFAAALEADPRHLATAFNYGLRRWRRGDVTDEAVIEEIGTAAGDDGNRGKAGHLTALVHMERGDLEAARVLLEDLASEQPDDSEIQASLVALRSGQAPDACCVSEQLVPWDARADPADGYTGQDEIPPQDWIRLTPDGLLALAASSRHEIRLWDVGGGKRRAVLKGHTGQIYSLDISADGRHAVSASADRTVRFWDLETGQCSHTVTLDAPAQVVRLSGDASVAVWSDHKSGIRVWDCRAMRHLLTLDGHRECSTLEVSPDGCWALSGDWTRHPALKLWDLTSGDCAWELADYGTKIQRIWLSPTGDAAVVIGQDGGIGDCGIRVWDLRNRRCVHTLVLPSEKGWTVNAAALNLDARFLLLGCGFLGTVTCWDLEHKRCLRTFHPPSHSLLDGVSAVWPAPDGRSALSASLNGMVRRWVLPGGFTAPMQPSRPRTHDALVQAADSLDALVAAAERATAAEQFQTAHRILLKARSIPGFERSRRVRMAWRALGTQTTRGSLRAAWPARVLDGRLSERQRTWSAMWSAAGVALAPDARLAAYSDTTGHIQIWDLETSALIKTIKGGQDPRGVRRYSQDVLRFSPDGHRITSASRYFAITVWSADSGALIRTLPLGHADRIALSSDGRRALVHDSAEGAIQHWDVYDGRCLRTLTGHRGRVGALWLSPDGRLGLSSSEVGEGCQVRLWDLTRGICLQTVHPYLGRVESLCLSADERFILSGATNLPPLDSDHPLNSKGLGILRLRHDLIRMRMWDVVTGECIQDFETHSPISSTRVELSTDGQFALAIDGDIEIYDVSSGRRTCTLDQHQRGATALALTPDGNFVLSADREETLRLWVLDWDLNPHEPADWDDGAAPYLEIFLAQYQKGFTDDNFADLLRQLQDAGYGWLRPEGIRAWLLRHCGHGRTPSPWPT